MGPTPHLILRFGMLWNHMFLTQWIRRYGPIAWRIRETDSTALDFFMSGFAKITVYTEKICDFTPPARKNAVVTIIPDILCHT
jgi:hypothetical protein